MVSFQLLNKAQHDRKRFDCGQAALNDYLNKTARQHDTLNISKTYVLVDDAASTQIIGFYTISTCHLKWEDLPLEMMKKYPRYEYSAAIIARLGVDKKFQGQGFGGALLLDAICRIANSSDSIPFPALFVDAKDQGAQNFYEHYGFVEITSKAKRLYLSMAEAKIIQAAHG